MIAEILGAGAENAKSASILCAALHIDRRELTLLIEKERRAGQPICASCHTPKGYYLAADREEMQQYIKQLHHRAGEIYKTRRACIKAAEMLPARVE